MPTLSDLQSLDPFWSRFRESETGCWEWTGCLNDKGYGICGKGRVHRVAYQKAVGPIPSGLNVLHECDNRPCGNPEHLTPGTQKKNLEDMRQRGRGVNPPDPRGARNPSAVLTEAQALEVKRSTGRLKDEAKRYGIAMSTVSAIRNGHLWKHLHV